jgi:hypothetical protein
MTLRTLPITDQLGWLPTHPQQAAAACSALPSGYDVYLKLLSPLGIDPSVPITSYSFAKRTSADLNARAAFWNTYHIERGQPDPARLQPISYREVSTRLDLAYDATLDSGAIRRHYGEWPPHLGSSPALEEAFVRQLVHILGPQQPAYCYGSAEEGNGVWDAEGFRQDWLAQGQVADLVPEFRQQGQLPTYCFAPDHAWCLYQGEAGWAVLGCSASLAQAFLEEATIEAFRL